MNYVILTIIVVILSLLYDNMKDSGDKTIRMALLLSICAVLCLFASLRSSYNDTKSYIAIFQSTPTNFYSIFADEFLIGNTYLSRIFNFLIYNFLSKDYHIYFFVCSVFFVVPAIFVMEKYSVNFSFSVLLFMTSGLYLFSLAAIRQSIAIGLLILGFDAFNQQRYRRYIYLCLLATSFHIYSIIALVLIFLKKEKLFGVKMNIACIGVLLLGVGMTEFSAFFSEFASVIGKDISQEEINTGSVSIYRAMVYLAPFILIFVSRIKLNRKNIYVQNVFVLLTILSAMLMTLALFGNPVLLGRLPYYFLFGTVISIPYVVNNAFTKSSVGLAKFMVILCYCAYEIYELHLDEAFTRDIFKLMWFS